MSEKLKLSKKQKEIVLAMRETEGVLRYIGTPSCKFIFKGKTLRYDLLDSLRVNAIITRVGKPVSGNVTYKLTPFGQSMAL